jgi:hypothetical protein
MSTADDRQAKLAPNPIEKRALESRMNTRFKGMMERKIERFFEKSKNFGWDYDGFVVTVLEIVTILHHKNKRS